MEDSSNPLEPKPSELLKLVDQLLEANPGGLSTEEISTSISEKLTNNKDQREILKTNLSNKLYKMLPKQEADGLLESSLGKRWQKARADTEGYRSVKIWKRKSPPKSEVEGLESRKNDQTSTKVSLEHSRNVFLYSIPMNLPAKRKVLSGFRRNSDRLPIKISMGIEDMAKESYPLRDFLAVDRSLLLQHIKSGYPEKWNELISIRSTPIFYEALLFYKWKYFSHSGKYEFTKLLNPEDVELVARGIEDLLGWIQTLAMKVENGTILKGFCEVCSSSE